MTLAAETKIVATEKTTGEDLIFILFFVAINKPNIAFEL